MGVLWLLLCFYASVFVWVDERDDEALRRMLESFLLNLYFSLLVVRSSMSLPQLSLSPSTHFVVAFTDFPVLQLARTFRFSFCLASRENNTHTRISSHSYSAAWVYKLAHGLRTLFKFLCGYMPLSLSGCVCA